MMIVCDVDFLNGEQFYFIFFLNFSYNFFNCKTLILATDNSYSVDSFFLCAIGSSEIIRNSFRIAIYCNFFSILFVKTLLEYYRKIRNDRSGSLYQCFLMFFGNIFRRYELWWYYNRIEFYRQINGRPKKKKKTYWFVV